MVALNKFSKDTQNEIDLVLRICKENGAFDAVLCENWEKGGLGGVSLAQVYFNENKKEFKNKNSFQKDFISQSVIEASNKKNQKEFKFLYELEEPIEEKIRTIAQKFVEFFWCRDKLKH